MKKPARAKRSVRFPADQPEFSSSFEVLQEACMIVRRDGTLLAANKQARHLLKLPSRFSTTTSLRTLFPSLDHQLFHKSKTGVIQTERRVRGAVDPIEVRWNSLKSDRYLVSMRAAELTDSPLPPSKRLKSSSFLSQVLVSDSTDEEGYYQSIVQHSPYGVGILLGEELVVVNQMFARILGHRSADMVLGRNILEFIEPQARKFFQLLLRRKIRGESVPDRFETQMIDINNNAIDIEATLTLGSHKGDVALNLTISDITLRKELEKRVTDSERLFRNVVNSMVDVLIITDLQGRVLDVNEEFERLTGYTRKEALNASIPYPWIDEEGLRIYMSWLEGLRSHNELRDFDITWVNKGGKKIEVSLNTTLLHNAAGDPILMVNIARDITERQTARVELDRQLSRLGVLYELSKMLGGTLDPVEIGRITFRQLKKVIPTDAFYIDLYDEERQEVRWLYVVDIIDGKQKEIAAPQDPIPLEEQTASWNVIMKRRALLDLRQTIPPKPLLMPFGNMAQASASLMHVPMFSKDRIIGIMSAQSYQLNAYTRDQLTLLESIANVVAIAIEKANLYQETVEKSTEIQERNKELDDFTYVVSHDLKEPLISVEGYAKIMRQEYAGSFDNTGREYMNSVIESCAHMKRLIEDLLQLSRVSKLAEERTSIDLYSLIEGVLEEMQYTVRERHAVIEIQPTLPKVIGVDQHLRIVFRNLLSNGIKFCVKPIPRISITAVPRGHLTEILVSDNGIGIEQEYFSRIFMIFQRLHQKEEYEGTGAGLTIVKKIIEGLGGQIWVTSKMGEGSTFHFTLPTS